MERAHANESMIMLASEHESASETPASTRPAGEASTHACPTCAANAKAAEPPAWIYAIGNVGWRFPRISVEKEFAQALAREKTTDLSDRQAFQAALSKPENRYLVRQLCWVMTIGGLDTYILLPRDPADIALLVETLRPTPEPSDLDCVIGVRGPIAPPDMCNGLMVPIVAFDKIYSFDRASLIKAIPRPGKVSAKEFEAKAAEVFDSMAQMRENAGATDADRAVNYLLLRDRRHYEAAAEAFGKNQSLSAVDVRPSTLSGTRTLVDVIFSFRHRTNDVVEKHAVRVDVTDEFPFLVKPLSPYYDF
jgi:hypothetical protein